MNNELKIIWSDFAENQLDQILKYYQKEVSLKRAKEIAKGIVKSTNKLLKTPYIGQEEVYLKERKIKYRYLLHKNYKLMYSVHQDEGCIKIADVFDVRQNPIKIKRI